MKNQISQVQLTLENFVTSKLHKVIISKTQSELNNKAKLAFWFKLNEEIRNQLTSKIKGNL
jgi:hypothetical protein